MVEALATPKSWHGNPMASFRRAFGALGSARFHVVDPDIRHDLQHLKDLYFDDDLLSPVDPFLRRIYKLDAQAQRVNKRKLEGDDPGHAEKNTKGQRNVKGQQKKGQRTEHDVDIVDGMGSTSQFRMGPDWALGPGSTANDAMQEFAPLFSTG